MENFWTILSTELTVWLCFKRFLWLQNGDWMRDWGWFRRIGTKLLLPCRTKRWGLLRHGGGVTAEMERRARIQEIFRMKTKNTQGLAVKVKEKGISRMTPRTLICATGLMDRPLTEMGHWKQWTSIKQRLSVWLRAGWFTFPCKLNGQLDMWIWIAQKAYTSGTHVSILYVVYNYSHVHKWHL